MDDLTHPRKGKWRKTSKKASKHDKRTPRSHPVPEEDDTIIPLEAISIPAQSPCTGATPHLGHLYATTGYRGYMDYVNTTTHCSCPSCKQQQALNLAWMKKNKSRLEDAEEAYVAAFAAYCDAEEERYETYRLLIKDRRW
jgi:hypothetical protein